MRTGDASRPNGGLTKPARLVALLRRGAGLIAVIAMLSAISGWREPPATQSMQALRPTNEYPIVLSVVDHVHVPGRAAGAIGVDPTMNRVYVANQRDSRIAVIDGNSDLVTAVAHGGCCGHYDVTVDHLANKVFASAIDEGVYAIDQDTLTASGARSAYSPEGIDVAPRLNRVYIAGLCRPTYLSCVVVDKARTGKLVHRFLFGSEMAINTSTNTGYIAQDPYDTTPDFIAVVDLVTNKIVGRLPFTADSLSFNRRTGMLYAAWGTSLMAIDTSTGTVTASQTLSSPVYLNFLAVDAVANRLYFVGTSALIAYNARTLRQVGSAGLPPDANAVAVNPRTGRVYVASSSRGVYVYASDG